MKKLIHNLTFYYDYYIGYFMYSRNSNQDKWTTYILGKYPEKFPNEVKYLEELKNKTK